LRRGFRFREEWVEQDYDCLNPIENQMDYQTGKQAASVCANSRQRDTDQRDYSNYSEIILVLEKMNGRKEQRDETNRCR
jgi:hypothetical protein